MEGGQKTEIPLDSGLDVKSSDQLVPVSNPLFQHNRQRFQGSMLPTSLRYEHNGWACGWDVYEFEADVTAVNTEPEGYTVIRTKLNDNPTYIFQVRSGTVTYVRVYYNMEDSDKTGGLTIEHCADDFTKVTVAGENNGNAFEITIDMATGEISYDAENWYVSESSYFNATGSDGVTQLDVVDLNSWVSFNLAVIEAEDAKYNGSTLASYYSASGGKHAWKSGSGESWEIEYDESAEAVSVNGEDAPAARSGGQLSITYDTEYSGTIDATAKCEEFYLQASDIYMSQTSAYVDMSNITTESFGQWTANMTGSAYLSPTDGTSPYCTLSGYVPFWCGVRLLQTVSGSSTTVSITELGSSSEYPAADANGILSCSIYLMTVGSYMRLYKSDVRGYSAQFWLGAEECLSKYGSVSSTSSSSYDSIRAEFTFCACVFNRIALAEGVSGTYGIPLRAGNSSAESIELEERAVWYDGGELETLDDGNTAPFVEGFYYPAAYHEGGAVAASGDASAEYAAGWYLADDDGAPRPDLYPDSYSVSAIAKELVVDNETYSNYVRLDEPYAFYDIQVVSEDWPGSMYVGYNSSSKTVAQNCVDMLISLTYTTWSDVESQKTYYLGEAGYLIPYFINSSDSSADTRDIADYAVVSSGGTSGSVTLVFNSGPLAGFGIVSKFVTEGGGTYSNSDGGSYSTSGDADVAAQLWVSNKKQELADAGYEVTGSDYTVVDKSYDSSGYGNWVMRYGYTANVYTESYTASALIYKNGTKIYSASSDKEASLSSLANYFDIAPLYSGIKVTGCGTGEDFRYDQMSIWISLCYPAYYQYSLKMSNALGDGSFTSGSLLGSLELSGSLDAQLLRSSGFYIDREADNSSGSYSGGDAACTFFGINMLQLKKYSASISSGAMTAYLYLCPIEDSSGEYADVCSYSGSDSDVYIPGPVYYGSASYLLQGYNLTGSKLATSYASSSLILQVKGSVASFYRIASLSLSWTAESGSHEFYSACLPQATGLLSAGSPFFGITSSVSNRNESAAQSVNLSFNRQTAQLLASFSLADGEASTALSISGGDSMEYNGYSFAFGLSSYSWSGTTNAVTLSVAVPLSYLITAGLPYQYNYNSLSHDSGTGKYIVDGAEADSLPVGTFAESYDSSTDTYGFVSSGGYSYKYSGSTKEITYGSDAYDTEKVGDARTAEIESLEYFEISFILQGAYKISKGEIVSFTGNSITFKYNDQEYSFDSSGLMSDESLNRLAFMYTDTTDDSAVPQSVTFAVQDTEGEYQFLRQAWNTLVEVENYWWIDENTILELNKTSLTVKRKVSSLDGYDADSDVDIDDWGGDAWVDAYSFDRGDYLDNTVARYGVTCAYGGEAPRFWTVKIASATSIQINLYELVRASDYSYSFSKTSVSVPVNVVSIGSELNASEGSLNTYSQLSAETIAYEAKYSGTVADGHILFGIHLDSNFNQWALDIYGGSVNLVVQGYGFVGLDGCLTGGEIPSAFFNAASGFSGTVLPIDELEQDEVEYVSSMSAFLALDAEGKVIGDESQQWYISKSLSGIVSHLTWNGGSWDAVALPITNTYSACYGSPSYGKRVISDYSFWGQKLSDLVTDDTFSSAIDDLTNMITTKVYGFSPKVTTALYLQQTMGQYAYVHYNSASPGKEKDLTREDDSENIFGDYGVTGTSYTAIGSARKKREEPVEAVSPENSDDFSFNLHGIRQSVAVEKPWSGSYGIILVLMSSLSALTSTLSSVLETTKVNAAEGKVNIGMKGSEMSQIFLQNMADLATSDISVIGVLPELQSAVSSACTLDMFYSTSEGQKIEAGPGWVQHNMVAQCVAQSVTSCQWEMQQIGMLWILDGISSIAAWIAYEAAKIAWDIACAEADSTKEGTTMSTNYGWIAAVTIIGLAGIAYAVAATYKVKAEITDQLVRSICGGGAKTEVQNASSKHTYDVEGKHKYGQKSEVFMWPCFGVNSANEYTDETVSSVLSEHNWTLKVPLYSGQSFMGGLHASLGTVTLEGALGSERQDDDVISNFDGDVLYQIANCRGSRTTRTLPSDMAVIVGSDSFLPPVPFRNSNIGVSPPTFPTPCFQDYIIDKDWELSRTASQSMTQWISCKDTKLIDGEASNIVVSDDFCGVAAPYVAIEVKRGCEQKYIRPWAITPNALALNQTGFNCCYDRKAYHAFDGYGKRIVKWCGASGMNKEGRVFQYSFIVNDRFKRSNKMPVDEFIGNFKGDPILAMRTTGDDWVCNLVTFMSRGVGLEAGVVGEDKDSRRYALPVFSELVSTLPAVVKTISSSNLSVIDGITSLTTDVRDAQSAYKAPVSVDFAIGKDKYRFTEEYICRLDVEADSGVTTVSNVVPSLGLTFLGATPNEAYFYSQATRKYYSYTGGSKLQAVDTLERFRDVLFGRYDFVNQEVALPCVATFDRLDKHVHDDEDERDNTMVPLMRDGAFSGEVSPPIETLWNMRSGFRTVSLPSGLCYQGPNRCVINRFVYSDYMKGQIIENYGKWKRVPRERYHPFRDYGCEYERVDESVDSTLVGWTHNPFLLVTSPLGVNSETDCLFEWEITFAWPVEMDELYGCGQYAVVNVMGECFTPGGKVIPDRPAHVFLWKDLFTRTGNYGYYSFRYQSKCGAGNRERLHIWSDQYIAVSGLQVDVKTVTEKRTEALTQQADVMEMEEI